MTALTRAEIPAADRVVVKVGSSSISGDNAHRIDNIVEALAAAHARGTEIVLVSSGAIATALPFLDLAGRPSDLATQQAAAAVGQNVLMWRYQTSLDRRSEEHTSELQSLMRISYAVFCLKKKKKPNNHTPHKIHK